MENRIESAPDWGFWVSATRTRNWLKHDPLVDWLELYGVENGFQKDNESSSFIPEADFTEFIIRKGREFEGRVIELLSGRLAAAGLSDIVRVAEEPQDSRKRECRDRTIDLMRSGVSVILQGVLWEEDLCVYGMPDLLVRSDMLGVLCDSEIAYPWATDGAPAFGTSGYHYVVVDVKYRGFGLATNFEANNDAEHYKAQLAIYNAALASMQGYAPKQAFFIGRKWDKGSGKNKDGATSCLDRLIPVTLPVQDQFRAEPIDWLARAMEAVEWVRRVRTEGMNWRVLPAPSVNELRPNMKNAQDSPWHNAKKEIAAELGELTQLWQVGLQTRNDMVMAGCSQWRDPEFRFDLLGNGSGSTAERRATMLALNRNPDGPAHYPAVVDWVREEWATPEALEFFVDFETTSNLDDDFVNLPEIGGQPLIFMIGCGHWEPVSDEARQDPRWSLDPERRKWVFRIFCTDALTEAEEKRIVFEWYRYMEEVRLRTPGAQERPKVFHWSPAETRTYSIGTDSAFERHLRPEGWPEPNWYDFLQNVVRQKGTSNAFFVRGAWGFGLKAIGKALHGHGLIETLWEDGPADGLAAMSGSWACYRIAEERGVAVEEVVLEDIAGNTHHLFNEIVQYNEVDCRVMAECIQVLRAL